MGIWEEIGQKCISEHPLSLYMRVVCAYVCKNIYTVYSLLTRTPVTLLR